MESDRIQQRLWASIHRTTRKRLQIYANAEDLSLGTAAARLVRAGLERHAEINRERLIYSPRAFKRMHVLVPAKRGELVVA